MLGRSSATPVFIALTLVSEYLSQAPFTVCTITCKRRRCLPVHTRRGLIGALISVGWTGRIPALEVLLGLVSVPWNFVYSCGENK